MSYDFVHVLKEDYNTDLLFSLCQIIYINKIFNRNPITTDKKLSLNDYTEEMFNANLKYLEEKEKLDLSKIDNLLDYNGWISDDRILTPIDFAANFLDKVKRDYAEDSCGFTRSYDYELL